MAIQFLNSIDLNQNQLIKPRIENLGGDPSGVEGQIYFNTTTFALKLYANGSWRSIDDSSTTNVDSLSNSFGTFITGTNNSSATGAVSLGTINLSATGTPDSTKFLRGDNSWQVVAGYTGWSLAGNIGTPQSIDSGQTAYIYGGAGIITDTVLTDTLTIDIDYGGSNNYIVVNTTTGTATAADILAFSQTNVKKTTFGDIPMAALTLVKTYIDNSVAGGVVWQGGYNASTNVPNLDSPPTGTIDKGFMYSVTVDGLFFAEQVRIGDVLIANITTPLVLTDWTIIQSNVDYASAGTTSTAVRGISGFSSDNFTVSATGFVELIAGSTTSYATTIYASGSITYSFTATTINDVIIQLVDTVTNETVYADVDRTSTSTAYITFTPSPPTNPIRVLVQKIQ